MSQHLPKYFRFPYTCEGQVENANYRSFIDSTESSSPFNISKVCAVENFNVETLIRFSFILPAVSPLTLKWTQSLIIK